MWARLHRWRWTLVIVALFVLGLGYSFWPERVPVDTASVSRGPMMVGITDDGVTRVRELYTVYAPVAGQVTRIELDPGDPVIAGQTIIARMAPLPPPPLDIRTQDELRNALRAAQAAADGAQAALRLARSDLDRAERLAQRGFLPLAQLEAARMTSQTRAADLERSRAEIGRLRAAIRQSQGVAGRPANIAVRSPESGVVLRRLSESEGAILQGAPLIEIGDPGRIEVVLDLLSHEAVRVKPGAQVLVTRWGGEEVLPGQVRRIEPFGRLKVSALGIEEQRVDVIVDFDPKVAPRIAALGHGYQVDGTIVLWRDSDALRVPVGALFRGGDGNWQVFVVDQGRARQRDVKLGPINDEFAAVLGGLREGAEVLINPGSDVTDGVRVARR